MTDDRGPFLPVDPFVSVGTMTLVATAAAWSVATTPTGARTIQTSLPLLLGLALVVHGRRRATPETPADRRVTVVWAGTGIVTLVVVGVWFFLVGATFETAYGVAVVTSLAVGATLGLLIGGYASGLRRSNRQLTDRTERLERFASIVSHDLRNPLSVARGRLNLARSDLAETGVDEDVMARIDDDLATVNEAHDRMERLTDRLLDLAREGTAVEDPVVLDIAGVARELWETVATGDADLVVEVDRRVRGDRDRIGQLFENLFRNAVEHGSTTPDDTSVTVTVGDLDDGFFVADDGPGIPPEDRARVFESGESGAGGTGLGLAIVQGVVDAHDWSVSVMEGTDGGARFEIRGVETDGPGDESET